MRFTTITAQRPGLCARCHQPITVGTVMRYGGPGHEYHLRADCPTPQFEFSRPQETHTHDAD